MQFLCHSNLSLISTKKEIQFCGITFLGNIVTKISNNMSKRYVLNLFTNLIKALKLWLMKNPAQSVKGVFRFAQKEYLL